MTKANALERSKLKKNQSAVPYCSIFLALWIELWLSIFVNHKRQVCKWFFACELWRIQLNLNSWEEAAIDIWFVVTAFGKARRWLHHLVRLANLNYQGHSNCHVPFLQVKEMSGNWNKITIKEITIMAMKQPPAGVIRPEPKDRVTSRRNADCVLHRIFFARSSR